MHDVADPKEGAPDDLAARAQICALIAARVDSLSPRMRQVLTGIYVEGTTLKEIGRALGVSESRVCQIHGEALTALRSAFAAAEGAADTASESDEAPSSQVRMVAARPVAKSKSTAAARRISRAS